MTDELRELIERLRAKRTISSHGLGTAFADQLCEEAADALQSLSERNAEQRKAVEFAFQKGADLAAFIANQRQNPQPPMMKQLDEMADFLVAVRSSLECDKC